MSDLQGLALLHAVVEHPEDWDRYRVYADWLLEHGVGCLAHAYRWMAARRKRPYHRLRYHYPRAPGRAVPAKVGWAWYSLAARPWLCHLEGQRMPGQDGVPRLVYLTTGASSVQRLCPNWDAAVSLLASGLRQMREDYET